MARLPDDPEELLAQAVQAWTDGEPTDLTHSYLALPRQGPTVRGTTLPSLGEYFMKHGRAGLIVPVSTERERSPVDLMSLVVTPMDVGLERAELHDVVQEMSRCPLDGTVTVLAGLMARLRDRGTERQAVDRDFAKESFTPPVLGPVLAQIDKGNYVVTEHNVLKLIEYALRHCYVASDQRQPAAESLAWMMLVLNDHLYGNEDPDETAPDLGVRLDGEPIAHASMLTADMVANQYFNAERDVVSLVARFQRRWREMPAEDRAGGRGIDLAELYRSATGVDIDDLAAFATILWAMSTQGSPVLDPQAVMRRLSWDTEQLAAVLQLLGRDRRSMVEAIDNDDYPGTWSFSTFERFPVLVDSGRLIVLDHDFVLNRVFGWLPIFDIADASNGANASSVTNYLRDNTERCVLEVLEQFGPRHGAFKCLWDERELKQTYQRKPGDKVCDAVLEAPRAWIAVEVSTRQLQRKVAASASPHALLDDIMRGVVQKAKQLEATLTYLREDESALTARPTDAGRRFVPILLISEGFPLGPFTRTIIDYHLLQAGVLQQPEFRPLHILGLHELELLEEAVRAGHGSLIELLDAHARSSMAQMNLRDFLVDHVGGHRRPDRQLRLWERALAVVTERLQWQPGEAESA